jgi:hypothetical protein
VHIGKNLSDSFLLFRMAWKKQTLYRHCFSTLLWNKPLGGSKRNREGWNWKGTHQLLACADYINMLGENMSTISFIRC